jgi:signal transduction histidine kinase
MATRGAGGLSRWVELRRSGPPALLNALFWGCIALIALYLGANLLLDVGELPSPALAIATLIALIPACVLWPLLPWEQECPAYRKTASLLFLALSLLLVMAGSLPMLFLVAVGMVNAVAVFGVAGGLYYSAATTVAAFTVSLYNLDQPLWLILLQPLIMLLVCLALLMIAVALLEAARRGEQTRRLLAQLESAHEELRRHAARIRELTVAEERARMAREMHDSTGHYLTAINMSLSNAERFRSSRPEAVWDEVRQAQELTQEALSDIRRWVRALKPLQLEGRAGISAMRSLADSFDSADIDVSFIAEGEWPHTAEDVELVYYRALQEGLANALRHSGANRISVCVSCTADSATLTVRDNGRGAEPEVLATGFGLGGLRERVAEVGGVMEVGNCEDRGFELRVRIPRAAAAHEGRPERVVA